MAMAFSVSPRADVVELLVLQSIQHVHERQNMAVERPMDLHTHDLSLIHI